MKENEEFLRIKSLRYNVHIFHYVNGKLSLRKTLTFTFMYRVAINYNFTLFTYLRLTCLELASNTGNRHGIQDGNGT